MNFSEEGGALLTGKIWKPTFLLELESEPVKNGPAPQHCTVCDRQFIAINFCTSTGTISFVKPVFMCNEEKYLKKINCLTVFKNTLI